MASEVSITRRNAYKQDVLIMETITADRTWTVLGNAKDNLFDVITFGTGNGRSTVGYENSDDSINMYAFGSGWLNRNSLTLTPGASISITVGAGKTTTFRIYLSANKDGSGGFYIENSQTDPFTLAEGGCVIIQYTPK